MSIKCILFDADGVVINAEMFSVQYEREFGVSQDEMSSFFKDEFQNCIVGKADLIELVKPWLSKWKWKGTTDDFLEYWFKEEDRVDERVVSTIRELKEKDIKCCLATNQEKYRTHYMKDKMGFAELFDLVFSSADIGHKKPEKEFYEFILYEIKNSYGIHSNEVAFFDDSAGHVQAAKELNMNAYVYNDFDDLRKVINKILPSFK